MPASFTKAKWVALSAVFALALTLLSSLVERKGPELASYGNLCGPSGNQDCVEQVLNAGYPLPYLFDQPGVSVERRLLFLQDNVRPLPLALDFFVYFAIAAAAILAVQRFRNAASKPPPRSDA